AWVVARSGGVRTGGPLRPMPRSPHSKSTSPRTRGRRLGQTPQPAPRQGRLALHNRDRSHQAQAPIPRALDESADQRRLDQPPEPNARAENKFRVARLVAPSAALERGQDRTIAAVTAYGEIVEPHFRERV